MKKAAKPVALLLSLALSASLLSACGSTATTSPTPAVSSETVGTSENVAASSDTLVIAKQGIFSAGGTVTQSDGTFDVSNYYTSREGSTSHVDHANVFYQIPENDTELPMVFLHGYGQSRAGWMTTPDGRICFSKWVTVYS